mmetsp:Transcript_83168/g.258276  ORF Transcript_83168/g.258276 Transcript_83168/m.258276 type:complete len:310 (+) Transcript_83168:699-1628(+)
MIRSATLQTARSMALPRTQQQAPRMAMHTKEQACHIQQAQPPRQVQQMQPLLPASPIRSLGLLRAIRSAQQQHPGERPQQQWPPPLPPLTYPIVLALLRPPPQGVQQSDCMIMQIMEFPLKRRHTRHITLAKKSGKSALSCGISAAGTVGRASGAAVQAPYASIRGGYSLSACPNPGTPITISALFRETCTAQHFGPASTKGRRSAPYCGLSAAGGAGRGRRAASRAPLASARVLSTRSAYLHPGRHLQNPHPSCMVPPCQRALPCQPAPQHQRAPLCQPSPSGRTLARSPRTRAITSPPRRAPPPTRI